MNNRFTVKQVSESGTLKRGSSLMRFGFIMTVANVGTGALNYLYQIIMGRMLSPTEFALFSTILALSMFLSSPLNALLMIISRRVSSIRAQSGPVELSNLYWGAHAYLFLVGSILFLLLLQLVGLIQIWLKTPSQTEIWLFGGVLFCFAIININNAFFQGQQYFGWLSITGGGAVLLKIGGGAVLVSSGFGVSGALAGLLLATAAVWIVGLVKITNGLPRPCNLKNQSGADFSIRKYLPVLVANIAFAAMTQLDMVLVSWYFSPHEASQYAAASVLGKAVLYLPGGLVFALFPMVAEEHARKQSTGHLLRQAVLLTLVLCGATAVIYWWLGGWLVGLLYGPEYAAAGELLRWYGFAILPMALVMVAEHFLIAKGRVLFVWIFMAVAPIQVLAIQFWHDQLWQVITAMAACGCVLVIVGYGMLWLDLNGKKIKVV